MHTFSFRFKDTNFVSNVFKEILLPLRIQWNAISLEISLVLFRGFYLFLANMMLIYYWFPNGLKPKRVSNFSINYFWNSQESKGEGGRILFFHFQIFEIFGNLEIYFSISFCCFGTIINILILYYFIVKLSTHYKTDSKHATPMQIAPGILQFIYL